MDKFEFRSELIPSGMNTDKLSHYDIFGSALIWNFLFGSRQMRR